MFLCPYTSCATLRELVQRLEAAVQELDRQQQQGPELTLALRRVQRHMDAAKHAFEGCQVCCSCVCVMRLACRMALRPVVLSAQDPRASSA